jgi:hypothetical protein
MDPKQTNFVLRDRVPASKHIAGSLLSIVGCIACTVFVYKEFSSPTETFLIALVCLFFIPVLFFSSLVLSSMTMLHFDLREKKYKKVSIVAGIKISSGWKPLPDIEYVSVFCQQYGNVDTEDTATYDYTVNLWYKTNKHFTIYSNSIAEPCFNLAHQIAAKLKTDLLDATEPGNFKWLEVERAPEEQTA